MTAREIAGATVYELEPEGPAITTERHVSDILGEAMGYGADLVVIPVARLTGDFFVLRTRLAGEFLQKFVNYHMRVAVIGDIAQPVAESKALHDFVYESNRGNQIWFLESHEALEAKLQG
jgi:hypothetical protein